MRALEFYTALRGEGVSRWQAVLFVYRAIRRSRGRVGRPWTYWRMHKRIYISFTYRQALFAGLIIMALLALIIIYARPCPCASEPAPTFTQPQQRQASTAVIAQVQGCGGD